MSSFEILIALASILLLACGEQALSDQIAASVAPDPLSVAIDQLRDVENINGDHAPKAAHASAHDDHTKTPAESLSSSTSSAKVTIKPPEIQYQPVPILPPAYRIGLELLDMYDNEQFQVDEEQNEGRSRHSLRTNSVNISCLFSSLASEGYAVEGVKCSLVGELPQRCFCSHNFCRKYVSITTILQYLRSNKAAFAKKILASAGGVEIWTWSSTHNKLTVEAVYILVKGHIAKSTTPTVYDRLSPVSFTIKGPGSLLKLTGGEIWFQYKVSSWSTTSADKEVLMSTPAGVFCPSHERKFIPALENQFSLTMETIIENLGTISYERQSYESEQKLVSFTYHPHLHSESMFLLNIPGLSKISTETYKVVHNFKTGIQYMINEETKNCTIEAIPLSALDATPTENQQVRLRHSSELIFIDPAKFIYKGMRTIRGMLCDVWIAERGVRKGRYSTVEVFFSHENWTVEVEVFNKVRQIPIGVTSYVADANHPNVWTSVVHTYFTEYTVGHHSWEAFDISPCLSRVHGMFLILTLQVSYGELSHYNLELVETSIRKAISGVAGVSSLRVTDLYIRSQPSTREVDVWFVLLEKPDISGSVMTPRPQIPMAGAFHTLQEITKMNNVSIRLDLTPTKRLFVTVKMGSLRTATEALHPKLRKDSHRLLSAGYTAGSVAGLGFSMAILGTCVGIFVGFLLWKKTPNIPYHIRI